MMNTRRIQTAAYGHHKHHINLNRMILTLLVFMSAYLITIRADAQTAIVPADTIQLNADKNAVITGTVKEADENWIIIDSAGKDMKIVLDKVHLKDESDKVFEPGMFVTVEGEMEGNDFGVPLVDARSVTATQAPVQ